MKRILKLLNQSYSLPKSGRETIGISLFLGLFIGGFLVFFKPFAINLHNTYSNNWEIAFFGVISTLVHLVICLLLPFLFPKTFTEKNWRLKHQIAFYLFILFVIATFNGLYVNYLLSLSFSWHNYGLMISNTIGLGIFPILMYTFFIYNRSLRQHLEAVQQITPHIEKQVQEQAAAPIDATPKTSFEIDTQVKSDVLTIDEQTFLFAQTDGNYTQVYILPNTKTIHRVTLNSLSNQLGDSKYLVRCHRSFLVNLKQVDKIEGNAQGLKLWLNTDTLTEPVPVSRKYVPIVKNHFRKTA